MMSDISCWHYKWSVSTIYDCVLRFQSRIFQESTADAGSTAGSSGLSITDVSPMCLTLHVSASAGTASGASFPVHVHLSSCEGQHVRLLLFAALTGAVLFDQEVDVAAQDDLQTPVLLRVPLTELAAASHRAALAADEPPTSSSLTHASSKPVPLRLVVTTAAGAHHCQGGSPPPARLLATATLLAAPALLASELCSLHIVMEQEGGYQGLGAQQLWSSHWQPLMDDLPAQHPGIRCRWWPSAA
jgi:hypothetical protein